MIHRNRLQFQKIMRQIMTVSTFALQGFIVGKKFIVKEVVVLRKGTILPHYIFTYSMPWNFLTKSEKYYAS